MPAECWLGAVRDPESPPRVVFWGPDRPESLRIHVSLFATGLLGIGYEVLAVRALSQILENTVYSFTGILAVYLFGTALGGSVYQLWSPKLSFRAVTGYLAQGLSLACIAGLGLLLLVEYIYSGIREWLGQGMAMAGAMGGEICAAAVVLLLPTILMGMTFSHLAQSACGKKGGLGRALSVNTVGAAGAPFLFGVVVLPAIGLKTALVLVASRLPVSDSHAGATNAMDDFSRPGRPLRDPHFLARADSVRHAAAGRSGCKTLGRGHGSRFGSE